MEHNSLFSSEGSITSSPAPPAATPSPPVKDLPPPATSLPSPATPDQKDDILQQQIIHLDSKLLGTTIQLYTGTEIRRPELLPAGVLTRYDILCFEKLSSEEKKKLYQVYIKFPIKHIECYASLFVKACDAIGKEFYLYKVTGIDRKRLQSDLAIQRFQKKTESLQNRVDLAWENKVSITEFKKLVINWMTAWSALVRYYANAISKNKEEQ